MKTKYPILTARPIPSLMAAHSEEALEQIVVDRISASELVIGAYRFASAAHGAIGQRRKYVDEPYIVHPIAVAELVKSVPHTEEMLAAALLHDVVEDTPVTLEEIGAQFGNEVGDLVDWLTDVSRPQDGNRAARKHIDLLHTAKAPPEAKTIKLADLIDNARTISAHDPGFWRRFRAEMKALLAVMEEGDPTLWRRAAAQV
ncbi:HD domain-containing protein [Pelagibacterium sp. H642]|uniref:HD domain-containing protein n=1 Tax=Pelagibacterium sp. H642 TaxID=1881069 RepID=UPI0028162578|nr:HD domain-containing protein [Pelagibacterium sp. H642]WMT89390.1 HD domain-containing protein [Pelagibacterium sp. H642]